MSVFAQTFADPQKRMESQKMQNPNNKVANTRLIENLTITETIFAPKL